MVDGMDGPALPFHLVMILSYAYKGDEYDEWLEHSTVKASFSHVTAIVQIAFPNSQLAVAPSVTLFAWDEQCY